MKAIFFDLDGTLLLLKEPVHLTYRRFGAEVTEGKVKSLWRNLEREYLRVAYNYETTPEIEKEFWINFATTLCNGDKEIALKVYNYFGSGESRLLNQKLLNQFDREELGVFTNNDKRSHQILKDLGVYDKFKWIITAGELGVKKPSLQVFSDLKELTGFNDLTYVGNSLELDIEPAKKAGWKTIFASNSNVNP